MIQDLLSKDKIRQKNRPRVLLALVITGLALSGCATVKITYNNGNREAAQNVSTGIIKVEKNLLYGNVIADISIDKFNALGFNYGDSVDVKFSNGYTLEDIPYYTGYYTPAKEMLVLAYPGVEKIIIAQNYGALWDKSGLTDDDTVEISLDQPGKYRNVQEVLGKPYETDRKAFERDEEFSNYRSINTGRIRDGILYRSASPCANKYNRASYTDDLIKRDKIKTIIDLADGTEDIEAFINSEDYDSPYFRSLYEKGDVIPINLAVDYTAEEYKEKLAVGLRAMIAADGPYLIHCLEGKDRTGFVAILLEALTGATYDEMVADYMTSYKNYYGLDRQSTPEAYEMIKSCHFDPAFRYILGADSMADATTSDLESGAEQYLLSCGLTKDEIRRLKEKLT